MGLVASHATYNTHYHIVFPIKYRKSLDIPGLPDAIAEITKEIGLRYDVDFEAVGFDPTISTYSAHSLPRSIAAEK